MTPKPQASIAQFIAHQAFFWLNPLVFQEKKFRLRRSYSVGRVFESLTTHHFLVDRQKHITAHEAVFLSFALISGMPEDCL